MENVFSKNLIMGYGCSIPFVDNVINHLGEQSWMSRTLTMLFRRDPAKDKNRENIHYEGYQPYWPDGRTVGIGVDAFCKHGQRLLGLGKHLAGCEERLLKLVFLPLSGRDDDLNRIPGHRVRRFFIERRGQSGRLHFLDGTPTSIVFEIGRDETRVLNWVGLPSLEDGETLWFDIAAMPVETTSHVVRSRMVAEVS
jgi:hypothetical protein